MFHQGSLFGQLEAGFDHGFCGATRTPLDATTWVDHVAGWLDGSDRVFDELVERLPLTQRRGVQMFDRIVDEPRLSAWWRADSGGREPLDLLRSMRTLLADRYDEPFDSIGFNLYRDGNDSVAWHGDRHRHVVNNPVIAIVSVGAPRPLRLRPRTRPERAGRVSSSTWNLGYGDLFVMGGACQHDWEHCVPKVRRTTGPRLSITFRSA
jgi:alkylated DNA repair dioxygenase AlkB